MSDPPGIVPGMITGKLGERFAEHAGAGPGAELAGESSGAIPCACGEKADWDVYRALRARLYRKTRAHPGSPADEELADAVVGMASELDDWYALSVLGVLFVRWWTRDHPEDQPLLRRARLILILLVLRALAAARVPIPRARALAPDPGDTYARLLILAPAAPPAPAVIAGTRG